MASAGQYYCVRKMDLHFDYSGGFYPAALSPITSCLRGASSAATKLPILSVCTFQSLCVWVYVCGGLGEEQGCSMCVMNTVFRAM